MRLLKLLSGQKQSYVQHGCDLSAVADHSIVPSQLCITPLKHATALILFVIIFFKRGSSKGA
jgi:hypothetical protein